ncbi:MAG TPA: NAD+ synthase [Gammaproteobacteria bacterium]|nr:NAD+ synthase [Gammaproteobacteria bacterium]
MTHSNQDICIALAQLNFRVGDIRNNTEIIINNIKTARDQYHADIILFPELALVGYPPEDLLLRQALYTQSRKALRTIAAEARGIDVVVGHASAKNRVFYNSCSLLRNGQIEQTYHKQVLPNYGVFDEKRYFREGKESCLFDLKGTKTALSICEDIWEPAVCEQAAGSGAKLMLNINASPFHIDKLSLRRQILNHRVSESGLNLVYLNLIGGQDELVFDGGSMALNSAGELQYQAPQFEEGLYRLWLDVKQNRFYGKDPLDTHIPSREASVYKTLVIGIRDYVRKNGFKGVLIGLSGGIDSALTTAIAIDALGKENVEAVIMPSRYTSRMSVEDAEAMVALTGINAHTISIEHPLGAFDEVLEPVFTNLPQDTTEENIQARCRGIILMAISNKTGKLVLTTGNKSEMAVGYATLYGDMAGGFAPLKDASKTLVYSLSNWRNQQSPVIPRRIIERPPSAELRENQLDQDHLPPYDILDPILELYIEQDKSPAEIVRAGYDEEVVKKVVILVDRNEYKRRQSAPGVRITERAFGRDRRYPITSGYRE